MARQFAEISEAHRAFLARQHLFFVATAAPDGRVNLSPKGMDTLRVLDARRVAWLNLTGSGNETAAHLRESDRLTLMCCSFEAEPLILRLYGHARAIHPRDAEWRELAPHFPELPGARQIVDVRVDLVQTSCGFAVPLFDFVGDRQTLREWTERRGEAGIRDYWTEKNAVSLDGKSTGILD